MPDDVIGLNEPSTIDKRLDTNVVTRGAFDVHRERIILSKLNSTDDVDFDALFSLLLTDAQLRADEVGVKDDYQTGEILADIAGAGAVEDFIFTASVNMVIMESVGANLVSRADPFGGVPTSALGIRLTDLTPTYVPVVTTQVKVFIPVGASVMIYGLRRV